MASSVYLHVLYFGLCASSLLRGVSSRMAVYLLRGRTTLPFRLLAVGRADLHELRIRSDGESDIGIHLRPIAAGVGAGILFAEVGKQQPVMPGAIGAIHAVPGDGDQMGVAFIERSIFQQQQYVRLDPEAQARITSTFS